MAVMVETYEMQEVDSSGEPECDVESLALIEQLGLDGQKALVAKKDDGTSERMPYRLMTSEELFVYGLLMPTKTPLKRFSAEHMPLRVLQVAAHASELFDGKIYVWSAARPDVKDPILVGMRKDPEASWRDQEFILARWGDGLLPFAELAAKAIKVFREQTESRLSQIVSHATGTLAALREMPTSLVAAINFKVPSYSGD